MRIASIALLTLLAVATSASAADPVQLERVVLLYRHGVRTPLPGEIQLNEVNGRPWPGWAQAPGELTPHGAEGARLMGRADRQRLAAARLFPPQGCPAPSQIGFWANTDQRTIASAQAIAQGFAPGCSIVIGHRPEGSDDPLFHPIEAGAVDWNAQQAVAAIRHATGGPDALIAPHRDALAAMIKIMGCGQGHDASWCAPAQWHGALGVSPDGRHMVLSGPIADTSGTAEAILMAYAEGRPMREVGWGRATTPQLEQLSQLHALLFDVYARPDYMAGRVAAVMSRRIIQLLQDPTAPRLSVLVGSDNNIVALASILGIHFKLPGYAADDPPIGGALGIELWRNRRTGQPFVRIVYRAQSLAQLRELRQAPPLTLELRPASCPAPLCPLDRITSLLQRR